jgi:hypothetical protein
MANYTVDWFTDHIPLWKKYTSKFAIKNKKWKNVSSKYTSSDKPMCSALMVGVYEGMALAWLLDNVLTSPNSSAVVVDAFDYQDCVYNLGSPHWNPGVREAFERNVMQHHRERVHVFDGTLTHLAAELEGNGVVTGTRAIVGTMAHGFDIIYIDARDSVHALSSMTTAFELLAPGGIMIVQNYAHNREHDSACPRRGIDAFVNVYTPSLAKVLSPTFHFFLEKKKMSTVTSRMKQKACHIESYDEPKNKLPHCNRNRVIKK